MTITTRKIDIAREYLSDALDHYKGGHFFSAITLGAAAEELLGMAIAHLPTEIAGVPLTAPNALGGDMEGIAAFERKLFGTNRSEKEIRDDLLKPKNAAKHFKLPTESTVVLEDPKYTAGDYLLRAIRNYRMVFPHYPDQFQYEEEEITVYQMDQNPV